MYITAHEIGAPGRSVHRAVASALAGNAGYSLDITGHSLGAGVASVLAMMWADPTTGLIPNHQDCQQAEGYMRTASPFPAFTSSSLGRKLGSIITSFTYSYDLVCRLSSAPSKTSATVPLGSATKTSKPNTRWNHERSHEASVRIPIRSNGGKSATQNKEEFLVLRKTLEAIWVTRISSSRKSSLRPYGGR